MFRRVVSLEHKKGRVTICAGAIHVVKFSDRGGLSVCDGSGDDVHEAGVLLGIIRVVEPHQQYRVGL